MDAFTSEKPAALGKPKPIRFFPSDEKIISAATTATGMNRAEVLRRAVRLLDRQKNLVDGYEFLLRLTA